MKPEIGVLALQGAWQKHITMLQGIGVHASAVRHPHELKNCQALILPGGESTTMSILVNEYDLLEPIRAFAINNPVMGVCAGMILMADNIDDSGDNKRVTPLGLMPFGVIRNYYGRQLQSFNADIKLNFTTEGGVFRAPFIRAPAILIPEAGLGNKNRILATYDNRPVMIQTGKHIAMSFHPELTADTRIHEYWLRELIV